MLEEINTGKAVYFSLVLFAGIFLLTAIFGLPHFTQKEAFQLLEASAFSLVRVFIAFLLSIILGVSIGYYAAINETAGKIIIPLLDIGQSVPVLGFFPFAVLFLITLFHGNTIGIEIAAIFLIMTSMVWNLAFSVYESMNTIPKELLQMSESFGVKGWLLFKRVYLPACIPRLVYNSIISWSVAWYFLVACEIISLGSVNYKLTGLGAFLANSTASGDLTSVFVGLLVLSVLIISVNILLWRPLSLWANNFKYDATQSGMTKFKRSTLYRMFRWVPRFLTPRGAIPKAFERMLSYIQKKLSFLKVMLNALRILFILGILTFLGAIAWFIGSFVFSLFTSPLSPKVSEIPLALLYSTLRLLIAFLVSLAWTVPAAYLISKSERAKKYLIPIFEVSAAIPATALFPLFILVVNGVSNMEIPAILLILTGMQWYLLFNLIAGIQAIPVELEEVAKSFGIKGWLYWKKILLPAIFPSLITGSITAWGGGWNALILSEFVSYGQNVYSVSHGIGKLLDESAFQSGDLTLLTISLLSMVVLILIINHFVWKRLYNYASQKYHIEY